MPWSLHHSASQHNSAMLLALLGYGKQYLCDPWAHSHFVFGSSCWTLMLALFCFLEKERPEVKISQEKS
jgi:hypothetical protein